MNCKPGDLVVCVRTHPQFSQFIGRVFTVTHLSSKWKNNWHTEPKQYLDGGPLYVVFSDSCLRPIRPNDGEDEMLRIAGRPADEAA